jgi:acetoacetyl-CoA synthetase
VWPGELSAPLLGVALDVWDAEGTPVLDEFGELVITKPLPSMPTSFWGDRDGSAYRAAYFATFDDVWRHGDLVKRTRRGSLIVSGRSDSTLNRRGVRFGSADIYDVVEKLPEVREALVIGAELPDGGYWLPLFLVLEPGIALDDALRSRIETAIREQASPRHVPDEMIAVAGVPKTRTGKKLEVPVKRLIQGHRLEDVVNPNAVDDLGVLLEYTRFAANRSG